MSESPRADGLDVVVDRGVALATRDGVRLVMDIYRPARAGQALAGAWPVVMERTPYDRANPRICRFGEAAARHGWVFISQDVRGRGDSGGHFHMLTNVPDEGQDGEDTVLWLHQQPWFDGCLATVGGSFSAANQQALALRRPPGLKAQVLRDGGTNYHRRMLRYHGLFNVGMVLPWVLGQAASSPPVRADPKALDEITRMRADLGSWLPRLPLARGASPLAHAPEYEDIYFQMLENADDGPYWHNPTARLDGRWDEYPTDVAILMVSGWFAHHAAANLDKLREFSRRSTRPVRLIVGPWIHGPQMIEATTAGDADFGARAAALGPISSLWLDWIGAHAKPGPAGAQAVADPEPALSYFVMGTGDGHLTQEGRIFHGGEWRHADTWPLPGTRPHRIHLHADGRLNARAPDDERASLCYDFDPADPCPGIGGTNQQTEDLPSFILPGPRVQRHRATFAASRGCTGDIGERADVLVFRSAPLEHGLEVTGEIACELWVTTSAPDTDFVVRLIDEYPPQDGRPEGIALLISEGALRMRYRNRQPTAELVEPGRAYCIRIELGPTSNFFKPAHRLRLDVTSASFPGYDVNPNTGEALGRATGQQVARQTLHLSAAMPSALLLPLHRGDGDVLSR